MYGPSPLEIIGIGAGVVILLLLALAYPRAPLSQVLFSRPGPSYRDMGRLRGDTLRAARWYAIAAVMCGGTSLGAFHLSEFLTAERSQYALHAAAVMFTFFLLAGISSLLAFGTLLRAVTLPRAQDGPTSGAGEASATAQDSSHLPEGGQDSTPTG